MAASNDLNIGTAGYVVFDGTATFFGRTFQAGTGITLTNASGVAGNTTIALSGSGAGQTITGNSGGPLSPTAGNWNILTANSTVKFAGAVSTETLDFGLSNLLLGSNGAITSGTHNYGYGLGAAGATTSGTDNIAIGFNALAANQTQSTSIAIGTTALSTEATNGGMVGIGYQALKNQNNAFWNVAIGYQAGLGLTVGSYSTLIGTNAGYQLTSSLYSTAVGYFALSSETTGLYNTACGYNSLAYANLSSRNSCYGMQSGLSITTGVNNTAIGAFAYGNPGSPTTGSYNIFIGQSAGYNNSTTDSSNIIIGEALGTSGDNNTIRIGNNGSGNGQQNRCFIAGIDAVNVGSVATVVTEASNQLGTAVLTAGTGITITPTANTITIANTNPSGMPWTDVTGATQTLAVNQGYVTDHTNVTYTLPSTAALGDTIKIVGKLGLATITPNSNQQILMGSASGTVGVTGTAVATNVGDCIQLRCITAGASTIWRAENWVGNWTLT